MKYCLWCAQELHYVPGCGWLHPDGQLYQSYVDSDGRVRDDHCAHPTDDYGLALHIARDLKHRVPARQPPTPDQPDPKETP